MGLWRDGARSQPARAAHGNPGGGRRCERAQSRHAACRRRRLRPGRGRLPGAVESLRPGVFGFRPGADRARAAPGVAAATLRFLTRFVAVRPQEARAMLWSFAYFFCLLAAYY